MGKNRKGSNLKEEERINRELLQSCDRHDFMRIGESSNYRCRRCGGRVRSNEAYWYMQGLGHKDPPFSLYADVSA